MKLKKSFKDTFAVDITTFATRNLEWKPLLLNEHSPMMKCFSIRLTLSQPAGNGPATVGPKTITFLVTEDESVPNCIGIGSMSSSLLFFMVANQKSRTPTDPPTNVFPKYKMTASNTTKSVTSSISSAQKHDNEAEYPEIDPAILVTCNFKLTEGSHPIPALFGTGASVSVCPALDTWLHTPHSIMKNVTFPEPFSLSLGPNGQTLMYREIVAIPVSFIELSSTAIKGSWRQDQTVVCFVCSGLTQIRISGNLDVDGYVMRTLFKRALLMSIYDPRMPIYTVNPTANPPSETSTASKTKKSPINVITSLASSHPTESSSSSAIPVIVTQPAVVQNIQTPASSTPLPTVESTIIPYRPIGKKKIVASPPPSPSSLPIIGFHLSASQEDKFPFVNGSLLDSKSLSLSSSVSSQSLDLRLL